ncbi:hypothetical protein OH802_09385 [Nocardioides sp. NBC_00850]|mgnify:CR=1 FL=1|jgi:hypothetical protein|uniref:hypothetical protein n=1 Tax=unclassified Nocardioides TaxID=2615069 RepID=UPI00087EE0F4|nr:hypothetical protein [Nocardioides sp. YR527]WTA15360.1 hypothetical protein OH802_09385 [Nocardioides sp. NBC_00850]SDL22406.1 hypothetical protein SAMN05428985_111103 [Nocardioides sp. YR527]
MTGEPSETEVQDALRALRGEDDTLNERSVQTALDLHRLRDALTRFGDDEPSGDTKPARDRFRL